MILFNWYAVKDLDKYLVSPKLNDAKRLIAEIIAYHLEEPDFIEYFYRYTDEWLDEYRELDEEDRIKEIIKTGFNKLSLCEDPEKYNPFVGKRKEKNI